ncbi:hypothetical protein [Corynebacterium caspium]|uniref:hypothetical protein n=1 Tax=Corynebacterium caspium TaxID=234828 RepID=UPI000373AD00|nr:hypothetical protein [Corynebacterium caspium]WKD59699.1 Anti-sigma factor RsrA [Corynebacterium caspium DSM 44850]
MMPPKPAQNSPRNSNNSYPPCGPDLGHNIDILYARLIEAIAVADDECAALRAAIDSCPECFERLQREEMVRQLVKKCCGEVTAPPQLRRRIIAQIKVQTQF